MRLIEAVVLRVKDVEFAQREIIVREGKGSHLVKVKTLHEEDLAQGFGEVCLPFALDKKYPNAHGR